MAGVYEGESGIWSRVVIDGGDMSEEEVAAQVMRNKSDDIALACAGYLLGNITDGAETVYEVGERTESLAIRPEEAKLAHLVRCHPVKSGARGELVLEPADPTDPRRTPHVVDIMDMHRFIQVSRSEAGDETDLETAP